MLPILYDTDKICTVENCKNPIVNIVHNICIDHGRDLEKFPICDGRECGVGKFAGGSSFVCEHNNLYVLRQDLMTEWHFQKNGSPLNTSFSSGKKVWWKCSKSKCDCHEWEARIHDRTRIKGNNCPFCSVPCRKLCEHNNFAAKFEKIAAEWHPTKNELKPEQFSPYAGAKVWWKCSKAKCECHEWQAKICDRTKTDGKGNNCPFCSVPCKQVCEHTSITFTHPEIAKEWHPTKNNESKPDQFSYASAVKVWWKCSKAKCDCHEWEALISNRTTLDSGCPFCSIPCKKVCQHTNLTATHSKIAAEWHPTKNGDRKPFQYSHGSQIKIWWICSKNNKHVWCAAICDRSAGYGCPICKASKGEIIVADVLQKKKFDYIRQFRIIQLPTRKYDFKFDYIIKGILQQVIIEFDGSQHFERRKNYFAKTNSDFDKIRDIDILKTKGAFENGYYLIRINYLDINEVEYHIDCALKSFEKTTYTLYFSDDDMYMWLIDALAQH